MSDFENLLDDDPDRRMHERIHFSEELEVLTQAVVEPIFAQGEDISIGGIKFICAKAAFRPFLSEAEQQLLEQGQRVTQGGRLTLVLNADLHLASEIRSVSPAEADKSGWDAAKNLPVSPEAREGYIVCVAFTNLEDSQKTKLQEYLEAFV